VVSINREAGRNRGGGNADNDKYEVFSQESLTGRPTTTKSSSQFYLELLFGKSPVFAATIGTF